MVLLSGYPVNRSVASYRMLGFAVFCAILNGNGSHRFNRITCFFHDLFFKKLMIPLIVALWANNFKIV
jgi:hypothetical protein